MGLLTNNAKKILVVDDDKAITTLLETLLSNHGYSVLTAYDGLEAMVQVKKNIPDCSGIFRR